MKFSAPIMAAILVGLSPEAHGSPPVRAHDHGITVIARAGDKPTNLVMGDNIIDGPHTFNCRDVNGCLVTLAIYVAQDNTGSSITCAYIDGHDAKPKCGNDGSSPVIRRSFAKVEPGQHTVETHLQTDQSNGQLFQWEVEYTIYNKR